MKIYGKTKIGQGTFIGDNVTLGYPGKDEIALLKEKRFEEVDGAVIGDNCVLRDNGVIYSKAVLGNNVVTGHHYLVREETTVGNGTLIGSGAIIDDRCKIGSKVSIQSRVYIPTFSVIEDNVFLGPCCVLTNDKKMGRGDWKLEGIVVEQGARIGANATILPGVRIGRDAVIGSGAVVTKDVEPYAVMAGVPARKIKEVEIHDRRY